MTENAEGLEDKDIPPPIQDEATGWRDYSNPSYRYLVLGLLTLVYISNFVDRQVINVLAEFIIEDLSLSDTQFGLLSGFAFACIYVTMGIPIARIADRGNRRNIIAISVALWSIMTAVCGAAQNFAQLFMARVGVGVGEAGGSPPSHSIVSDIFPPHQRSTALSVYSLGVYGGILVGTVGGAYLVEYFSWRVAFVAVGVPGVLLAVLVRLIIKEPKRGLSEARKDVEASSFKEVLALLWSRKSFRHLSFACALHAFVTYGMGNFMVLFLRRVHELPLLDAGWYYGLTAGIGGLIGTFAGGWLSDYYARKTGDHRWYIWVPFISTLAAIPFALIVFQLAPSGISAALLYFLPVTLGGLYLAPCLAATHSMVGLRMRATASAVLLFVLNLIGLGIGPAATGYMSDLFFPIYGNDALRYALSLTVLVNLWCAAHYFMASKNYRHDYENAPA